ncbi:hypothetical protein Hanom_Chr06g00510481 [Helianthus anomalus]
MVLTCFLTEFWNIHVVCRPEVTGLSHENGGLCTLHKWEPCTPGFPMYDNSSNKNICILNRSHT